MENKVTLTYSFSEGSDENLFLTLSTKLVEALSENTIEWHHRYGRKLYTLYLKTKILPLTSALLERKDLVTRPYCHIFWTDCNEIDMYKSSLKSEISSWLNLLLKQINSEWIIVIVSGDPVSRLTKPKLMQRSSITDKVKSDFCSKNPERLHILHDTNRDSNRSSDSWISLSSKVAAMAVRCMETVVSKYEDQVRWERERRNEKTWDFCSYFLFQEELAFMYEMLGMFNSAQVQYDELDAMFTQYVLNANAGDYAHWLSQFSKPIVRWHSLLLWKPMDSNARLMIQQGEASLIDVRNYLFNRLCHLLFRVGKISEVIQRLHDFLHSIATEIEILEISLPAGAIECWIFMCCLELIEALKRRIRLQSEKPDNIKLDVTSDKLLLEYASLWNLARLKLQFLGKLCGLMPNDKTTSSHLQTVVDLLAGMGEGEERGEAAVSPALTLREALSSKNNFQKHYFELAELAIGTFKHMKHFRAARSIGSDLAEFYMLLDQPNKAESYLIDSVRMYASDGWITLYSEANKSLARCYKQMKNYRMYLRLCYALMCDNCLGEQERTFYCDEFSTLSMELGDRRLAVNLWPLAVVEWIQFNPAQTSFRLNEEHHMTLCINSFAPTSMEFQATHISLEFFEENSTSKGMFGGQISLKNSFGSTNLTKTSQSNNSKGLTKPKQRHFSSTSSKDIMVDDVAKMDSDGKVLLLNLNYEPLFGNHPSGLPGTLAFTDAVSVQEGEIEWAGVTCNRIHDLLRRQDSNPSQRANYSTVSSVVMESYDCCLSSNGFTLDPGLNTIKIPLKTDKVGSYQLQQLRLTLQKSFFMLPRIYPVFTYTVTSKPPTVTITQNPDSIAGLIQELTINIDLGDHRIMNQEHLNFNLPSNLQLLKTHKCIVTSTQGEKEVPPPELVVRDSSTSLELPPSSDYRSVSFCLLCVCAVEEVTHQLEPVSKHRRTYSAPPGTYTRSPKLVPRHLPIDERVVHENEEYVSTIKTPETPRRTANFSNENVDSPRTEKRNKPDKLDMIKSSLKETFDGSPFKLFRSKTPTSSLTALNKSESFRLTRHNKTNSEGNLPSLRVNGEFIEVMLDDDEVRDATSSDSPQNSSLFKDGIHFECPQDSLRPVIGEPITDSSHCADHFKLSASKSVSEVVNVRSHSKTTVRPQQSTTECQITVETPWNSVPPVTSLVEFSHPLEFTHAWNYSGACHRFLSVTVENVTSLKLSLRNPKLRFNNVTSEEMTYMGANNAIIKSNSTCMFVWKISLPSSASKQLHAIFTVHLLSCFENYSEHLSTAQYCFDLAFVKPIYTIKCNIASKEAIIQNGHMTLLHVEVERLREDPGHESTPTGQQLLMYQVVDNRGRWAVCGKSSGILSYKSTNFVASSADSVQIATMEVMPLASGQLHFPYVILHRYLKRKSSEFDEELSSTNSPVMKPPQLKEFGFGEVIYRDQARQINVVSTDGPSITKL